MTRSTSIPFVAGVAALLLTALALAGCGGNGNGSAAPPTTASGQSATLGVASGDLGKVLVDSQGHTLYLFQKDSGTKSACTGECANDWPPLRANGKPTEGSGATASLVTTIARPDGGPQVTYNSHPLYRFEGDTKAGDTNGEGVNAFGGSWFALSPAGTQISAPPAKSGGGGGYGY